MKKQVFLGPKFECKYMKVGNRLLLAILWPNITSDKPSYSQFNPFLKFSFLFWMKKVSRKWSIWAKFPHLIAWMGLFGLDSHGLEHFPLCLKMSPLMLKNKTTQFWSAWLGLAWNFIIRLGSAWDFFCLAQIGIEHFFAWLSLALEISTQVYRWNS